MVLDYDIRDTTPNFEASHFAWTPRSIVPTLALAVRSGMPNRLTVKADDCSAPLSSLERLDVTDRSISTEELQQCLARRLISERCDWLDVEMLEEGIQQLLERRPSHVPWRHQLHRGQPVIKHIAHAPQRYRQVVEMTPTFVDAWNNLGVLLAEMDLPHEAKEAFRRALNADPHNAMAHYHLTDVLTDLGKVEDAALHWKAFLQVDSISERAAYARRQLA